MKGILLLISVFLITVVMTSSCTQRDSETSESEDSQSSPLSVVNQAFKTRGEGDRETFNSLLFENRGYLWDEFDNCDGIIPTFYATESRTIYDEKPFSLISVFDGTDMNGNFSVIYSNGKWYLFDISGKIQCKSDPVDIPSSQGQLSEYESTIAETYNAIFQGSIAEYRDLVGYAGITSQKSLIEMYNDYRSPVVLSGNNFDDIGTQLIYPRKYIFDNNAIYFQSDSNSISTIDITTGEKLWQVEIGGILIGQGDTTILVYTYDNRIYSLEKKTGEQNWKIILGLLFSEEEEYSTIPFAQYYKGKIYIPLYSDCGEMHNLRFLNITESTGESYVTACNTNAYAERALAFSNGLFIADESTITAYDPNNGEVRWSVDPESISNFWSKGDNYLKILHFDTLNNVVYFQTLFDRGNGKNELYAVDIVTGNYLWRGGLFESNEMTMYHEQSPSTIYGDVLWGVGNFHITNNHVYYYTDDEILQFNINSGKFINRLGIERKYTPFFSDSGLMLYYQELRLAQGINPSTGELMWEEDEIPIPEIDPLTEYYISYENIVILLDKNTEEFFAYDLLTGKELWREKLNVYYLRPMRELVIDDIFGDPILFLQEEQGNTNIWTINPFSGDIKNIIGPVYLENYSGKLLSLEKINENTYILCNDKLLTVVKNQ